MILFGLCLSLVVASDARVLRFGRMADLRGGDGREVFPEETSDNARTPAPREGKLAAAQLTVSGSFQGEGEKAGGSKWRPPPVCPALEVDQFINLLHGSDPVKVELNHLENEIKGGNVVQIR